MTQVNASELIHILELVLPHGDDATQPSVCGIRLDCDQSVLHAIGTDGHTLAVARTPLYRQTSPWALTIPRPDVDCLLSWLRALDGDYQVSVIANTHTGRITFASDGAQLIIKARSGTYATWRDLLRTALASAHTTPTNTVALATGLLSRWSTAGWNVQIWTPATPEQPVIISGENFLGLQMPMHSAAVDRPSLSDWHDSLGPGNTTACLIPPLPDNSAATAFDANTLRRSVRAADEGLDATDNLDLCTALGDAGLYAWYTHRLLEVLRKANPHLAEHTIRDLIEETRDYDDFGERAFDAAREAGYDPQAWRDQYEAHREAKQRTAAHAATAEVGS